MVNCETNHGNLLNWPVTDH